MLGGQLGEKITATVDRRYASKVDQASKFGCNGCSSDKHVGGACKRNHASSAHFADDPQGPVNPTKRTNAGNGYGRHGPGGRNSFKVDHGQGSSTRQSEHPIQHHAAIPRHVHYLVGVISTGSGGVHHFHSRNVEGNSYDMPAPAEVVQLVSKRSGKPNGTCVDGEQSATHQHRGESAGDG